MNITKYDTTDLIYKADTHIDRLEIKIFYLTIYSIGITLFIIIYFILFYFTETKDENKK